jgi:hypothetical protein
MPAADAEVPAELVEYVVEHQQLEEQDVERLVPAEEVQVERPHVPQLAVRAPQQLHQPRRLDLCRRRALRLDTGGGDIAMDGERLAQADLVAGVRLHVVRVVVPALAWELRGEHVGEDLALDLLRQNRDDPLVLAEDVDDERARLAAQEHQAVLRPRVPVRPGRDHLRKYSCRVQLHVVRQRVRVRQGEEARRSALQLGAVEAAPHPERDLLNARRRRAEEHLSWDVGTCHY